MVMPNGLISYYRQQLQRGKKSEMAGQAGVGLDGVDGGGGDSASLEMHQPESFPFRDQRAKLFRKRRFARLARWRTS